MTGMTTQRLLKNLPAVTAAIAAVAAAWFTVAFTPSARAQESASNFEVTSVRPNKSGLGTYDFISQANRLIARNVSLFVLVQWAYQIEYFRISGGPPWMRSDRFDIEGKPSVNVSMDQQRLMLRTLMAERFHLKLHMRRESCRFTSSSPPKEVRN
jgi:hypothetical protein